MHPVIYAHEVVSAVVLIVCMTAYYLQQGGVITLRVGWLEIELRRR